MTETERRLAARQFSVDWQGRGDEKQETQTFWLALLQKVYGIAEPDKYINFEKTVNVDNTKTGKSNTKFIDGYIGATRVLIEQKGTKIDLNKGKHNRTGRCYPHISKRDAMADICRPTSSHAGLLFAISKSSESMI